MTHQFPNQKRVYIKTHIYKVGGEISPLMLFRITSRDINKYEKEGWSEVLMSFRQRGETISIQYTGIPSKGVNHATQNSDSETKETKEVNPFLETLRQAFSFFR
jgi:hypothetical protein